MPILLYGFSDHDISYDLFIELTPAQLARIGINKISDECRISKLQSELKKEITKNNSDQIETKFDVTCAMDQDIIPIEICVKTKYSKVGF